MELRLVFEIQLFDWPGRYFENFSRNMLTLAARNMVAFLSTDSPDIRTIQKDIFQINSLIPFTPQQARITLDYVMIT